MGNSIEQVDKNPIVRFHADENGKVSLLASMLMLALVALAGLVGNTGHVTKEKIEVQNAADSVAYSSALWMARGMNAVTATNHMIGEATAMAAVHEAYGGPELDHAIKRNTSENIALDGVLRSLAPIAPIAPSLYSPPPIPAADARVVQFVTKRISSADGRMTGFATIYDSRMTLKRRLAVVLPAKAFANLGFLVPPPWGFATAAAAYVVHIAGTIDIVLIGKEWLVLDVLELVARAFKPVKSVIEKQLVPTLEAHANFVASYDPSSGQFKPGILNGAIERAVLDLEKRLDVEASLFPEFKKLRLPVVGEPKPNLKGTTQPAGPWGTDTPITIDIPDLEIGNFRGKLDRAMNRMRARIGKLQDDLSDLDGFESDIEDRLDEDDVEADEKTELEREQKEIEDARERIQQRIEEIERKLDELISKQAQIEQTVGQSLPNQSANPSVDSLPDRLDQNQERYTQWVRATHPNMDGFRAPVLAWLKQWAPRSQSPKHFEKWTNRYTLVKAWQFRSGYRNRKSGNRVSWQKQKRPLQMLVINGTYRGSQNRKGFEKWTGDTPAAKSEAEQLFTLIGVAHREYQPLFSRALYPSPVESGMTNYAQAIFYNANPQRPTQQPGPAQAKIGWDTLNWNPDSNVSEWGAPPHQTAAKWPWEAFDGTEIRAVAGVKLNWQAKLMPVRATRIKEAAVTLRGDARKNMEHAAKHFENLGTH